MMNLSADAGGVFQAFDGAQHGHRRGNDAVAIEKRRAADAEEKDGGRIFAERLLRQGHQGQRAAFALVIGLHQEDDVLDRHHHNQRPEDERDHALDRQFGIGAFARMEQGFAHGVKRAGADIAEDDADRPDHQGHEAFPAVTVTRYRLGFRRMGITRTGRGSGAIFRLCHLRISAGRV